LNFELGLSMKNLRTFVAVELSGEVKARAMNLIDRLKTSGVKASWTNPEKMHLTLKFLGDTPETLLAEVCRAVQKASEKIACFELRFGGAGAFPHAQRPQILWMGVESGLAEVTSLQESVDEALFQLRYPRERRRFTPHLTLGRCRGGTPEQFQEIRRIIEENTAFPGGVSIIEEVVVFESMLERGAEPVYEALSRTELV
jgi:2'-5' RNA ligase